MNISQVVGTLPNLTSDQLDTIALLEERSELFFAAQEKAEASVGFDADRALSEVNGIDPSAFNLARATILGILAKENLTSEEYGALIADWQRIVGPFDLPLEIPDNPDTSDTDPGSSESLDSGSTSLESGLTPDPSIKEIAEKETSLSELETFTAWAPGDEAWVNVYKADFEGTIGYRETNGDRFFLSEELENFSPVSAAQE